MAGDFGVDSLGYPRIMRDPAKRRKRLEDRESTQRRGSDRVPRKRDDERKSPCETVLGFDKSIAGAEEYIRLVLRDQEVLEPVSFRGDR